jgi:hypothetical protein
LQPYFLIREKVDKEGMMPHGIFLVIPNKKKNDQSIYLHIRSIALNQSG